MWQWFLAHGDKLLVGVSSAITTLEASGVIPPSGAAHAVAALTALGAILHTIALPEPAPTAPSPTKP